jgi:hypothetical protein
MPFIELPKELPRSKQDRKECIADIAFFGTSHFESYWWLGIVPLLYSLSPNDTFHKIYLPFLQPGEKWSRRRYGPMDDFQKKNAKHLVLGITAKPNQKLSALSLVEGFEMASMVASDNAEVLEIDDKRSFSFWPDHKSFASDSHASEVLETVEAVIRRGANSEVISIVPTLGDLALRAVDLLGLGQELSREDRSEKIKAINRFYVPPDKRGEVASDVGNHLAPGLIRAHRAGIWLPPPLMPRLGLG